MQIKAPPQISPSVEVHGCQVVAVASCDVGGIARDGDPPHLLHVGVGEGGNDWRGGRRIRHVVDDEARVSSPRKPWYPQPQAIPGFREDMEEP